MRRTVIVTAARLICGIAVAVLAVDAAAAAAAADLLPADLQRAAADLIGAPSPAPPDTRPAVARAQRPSATGDAVDLAAVRVAASKARAAAVSSGQHARKPAVAAPAVRTRSSAPVVVTVHHRPVPTPTAVHVRAVAHVGSGRPVDTGRDDGTSHDRSTSDDRSASDGPMSDDGPGDH